MNNDLLFFSPMKDLCEYSQDTSVILCRFAFVEFATVAEAEKALNASQSIKISKREVGVQFYEMQEKPKGKWDCCSCDLRR